MTPLSYLSKGQKAQIVHFKTNESTLIRFMEMGLRLNEWVQMLGKLPLGGNVIVLSKYGKYTLREKTAQLIQTKTAP